MVRPPRTGMEAFELMPEGTLCQLINNTLVMAPTPHIPHADSQSLIFNTLFNFIARKKLGKAFCAPVDVYFNDNNVFQPDILFISRDQNEIIKRKGVYGAPDLIVEILSGDRNYDLKKKKKVYE